MTEPVLAASVCIRAVALALASSGIGPISASGLTDLLKIWTGVLANWVEIVAAIIIAGAVIEATIHAVALEFELAADILRTAIAPSWSEIGLLAAVAAIRTALNYFLEKEIERGASMRRAEEGGAPLPDGGRALRLRSPLARAERTQQRPAGQASSASAEKGDGHEPAPA